MSYEQFCRQLLLCSSIPQSLLTFSMRLAAVSSDDMRNQLFFALMEQQKQWIQTMTGVKKSIRTMNKNLDEVYTLRSA